MSFPCRSGLPPSVSHPTQAPSTAMNRNQPAPLLHDAYLLPFASALEQRRRKAQTLLTHLGAHADDWHLHFGLHRLPDRRWLLREWLPNVSQAWLVLDRDGEQRLPERQLRRDGDSGVWQLILPPDALRHGDTFRLDLEWPGGQGHRLPAAATRVIRRDCPQDPDGIRFLAQVWEPPTPYRWRHTRPAPPPAPLIYEAHVGMASQEPKIASFDEFRRDILPRIATAGYNTVQLMAIMEHPFYGSFGYHVSSFFAVCDLFGTPDDLKRLVDDAHGLGLRVIIDLVHSHAVKNPTEGIGLQDGTDFLYCHHGARGHHPAWDSRCFDYAKPQVCRFLLSNCRFWLDEYRVDGFRFDGVTSMLYLDHGLNRTFTSYDDYFSPNVDDDALAYLTAANTLIHRRYPHATTIAEDVSGMPGLGAPPRQGGCGFDFRLALGVTDCWFKLADIPDEHWPIGTLWHELTNRRDDEHSISYVECHDQSLVGGKTFIFTLADKAMYDAMDLGSQSLAAERACCLHKLARLITLATAGHGYLNFMGNEFGHPEWIDFPRPGNGWSLDHARRQWDLRDSPFLRYRGLADFDQAALALIASTPGFFAHRPQLIALDDDAKTILFERAGLFLAFNFHPQNAQPSLPMMVLPGSYSPALVSDSARFGGLGLIGDDWQTDATPSVVNGTQNWHIRLNLPPRTAIVLKRRAPVAKMPNK